MADANMQDFDKRVSRINKRKRQQSSRGAVLVMADDGLITTRVRRRGARFPWRGIFVVLAVFFALKGLLLSHLGPITYDERVAKLEAGTVFEQAGAFAMKADPVTKWAAENFNTYLK
ncbi:hypothetical protein ACFE33_03585 [Falsihalocynthiibacter sp. SS001]|uniref:hypothetical protein n=1 Tax=Falsihalocynthiibacter sp. SS001 TaxID=3349698 RepID=UPI0036D28181